MPLDLGTMLSDAEDRLARARDVADSCLGRGELHRTLMRSVFLMEDIVFLLHEMAALARETARLRNPSLADDRL